MVYKWAKIPEPAKIKRADGTEVLMNKIGEGTTRLVMFPNEASQSVSKIELKLKRDGRPEDLTNQDEVDMLKQVPPSWQLQFNETVEDVTVFSRWDEREHPATMMLVERFEKDLMGTLSQLMAVNDTVQLVTLVQIALHEMLNMAVVGFTISDMTLSNLCFHMGVIKVADWGCGQRNAPVSVLRTNFKKW
jgi:hypothetical protein